MRANFALLREQLQPFRCWAVVKANAYGHGLDAGLLGFEEADGLALIEPAFARYLREKGWRKPILLMEGIFDEADLISCVEARVDLVVHDVWQLKLIESHRCSAMLRETGVGFGSSLMAV